MQQIAVDTRPLRWAGAASLAVAATLPLVPGHDAITCPLRATTGLPCPFCGITRGVGEALRGNVDRALFLNPASVLLVAAVVVLLVGRRHRQTRIPVWLPVVALAAMWAFQLFKYATGRPL